MTRGQDERSSKPCPRPEGPTGRALWGNSCDVLAESDDRRRSCQSTKERNFFGADGSYGSGSGSRVQLLRRPWTLI